MSRQVGFPLRLDGGGRTRTVDEEVYLRGLIEQVLFTRPGERVNRPDFGTGVDALVFAPSGDEFAHTTESLVQAALQRFLGDLIRVEHVAVTAHEATLEVAVTYSPLRAAADDGARVVVVTGGTGP